MNPDPEDIEQLVEELRADLPSARDAARVKARLAGLGLAVGAGLSSSAAAAAVGAKGSAELGAVGFLSQVSAWSWGAKLGLAAAVSLPAVTAPIWLPAVTAPSAGVRPSSDVRAVEARSTPAERALRTPAPALGIDDGSGVSEPSALPSVRPLAVASDANAGVRPGREPAALGERSAQSERGVADSRWRASHVPAHPAAESDVAAPADRTETQLGATAITGFSGTGASSVTEPQAPAEGVTSMPNASSAPASQAATPGPPPAAAALSTLGEETALMDAALSALRAQDLATAARYVRAHEQRFPNGLLRRERERARRTLLERGRTRD